jgi:hypothetical protein
MARAEPAAMPPPRRPRSRRGWLALAAALLAVLVAASLPARRAGPPEVTPFAAPSLRALPEFGGAYARALLWGTYRPGLYFGLRARCVVVVAAALLLLSFPARASLAQPLEGLRRTLPARWQRLSPRRTTLLTARAPLPAVSRGQPPA